MNKTTKEDPNMNLEELRLDCSIKQKKGLHFILASIIIWCAVWVIHLTSLPILSKIYLHFVVLHLLCH